MDPTPSPSPTDPGRWILLIHHLPPKPDYLRVKVRRQLHRLGAVPLKNSVYVLPHSDLVRERLTALRQMIVEDGGEATVCVAAFVDGVDDDELQALFATQAEEGYRAVVDAAEAVSAAPTEGDLRRLRRQLLRASERDFFRARSAAAARRAVADVEETLVGSAGGAAPVPTAAAPPRGATWVTRRDVFIDRMASAWLIRRFIDPLAAFKFVPPKGYRPKTGEIRFDMVHGEFNCDAQRCTFQVLVQHFHPDDRALTWIGEIVHDVDVDGEKFGREEAAGVATLMRGIVGKHREDADRIDAGVTVFDGLYAALTP